MPDLTQSGFADAKFDCNILSRKALDPYQQQLMAEAPLERELEQDAPSVLDLVLELVSLVCGDCQPAQGQASRRIGDCRRKRPSCEAPLEIQGNPCLSTKPSESV